MNTGNLGNSGPGADAPPDLYSRYHLTQNHHLFRPHHSQHPSPICWTSSNPYSELFSPFATDFVALNDTGTNTDAPVDYFNLQNSLDYAVSYHQHHRHHHHHHHHQQQQQQHHHHHHQIASSTNGECTSSSIVNNMNDSNSSPSHSLGTSIGYSSPIDYYNTTILNSKTNVTNGNTSSANASNNSSTSTSNASSQSPYDDTSTASTTSPSHSIGYMTTNIKQENVILCSSAADSCSSYGTNKYTLDR